METQLELAGGAGPFARGARYNGYGAFLRERFGCRVYKVIVDAGFTCPNRDGTVAIGVDAGDELGLVVVLDRPGRAADRDGGGRGGG